MKARFEPAHRSQIQRQKVEKQRAVRLRRQRNHFPFLVLPRVVIDPLQVRGLTAQTWTVIHQLAVNFARRKIDERHFVLTRLVRKLIAHASRRGQMHKPKFSRALVPSLRACLPLARRSGQPGKARDLSSIAESPLSCSALPVSATTP